MVQVIAPGKSKISSSTRKREEAESGKCTDKRRRGTLDRKNSRRSQSKSSFSDDVMKRNKGRTANVERQSIIQVTGHAEEKSLNYYDEGSKGQHRELSHIISLNSTGYNIGQFPRIFSVVFSNQYGTDPASKQPSCFHRKQFPQLSSHV